MIAWLDNKTLKSKSSFKQIINAIHEYNSTIKMNETENKSNTKDGK